MYVKKIICSSRPLSVHKYRFLWLVNKLELDSSAGQLGSSSSSNSLQTYQKKKKKPEHTKARLMQPYAHVHCNIHSYTRACVNQFSFFGVIYKYMNAYYRCISISDFGFGVSSYGRENTINFFDAFTQCVPIISIRKFIHLSLKQGTRDSTEIFHWPYGFHAPLSIPRYWLWYKTVIVHAVHVDGLLLVVNAAVCATILWFPHFSPQNILINKNFIHGNVDIWRNHM